MAILNTVTGGSNDFSTAPLVRAFNEGPYFASVICTNVQTTAIRIAPRRMIPLACSTGVGTVSVVVDASSPCNVDVDTIQKT